MSHADVPGTKASIDMLREGAIWTIAIRRPERRNAIDRHTARALADAFRAFEADGESRVAVLWGEGSDFCAGADLHAIAALDGNQLSPEGDGPLGPTRMQLTKPTIAAIAGHAVAGGLELALWCDLRVAEEGATLGVYCRRFGVPLIDGGTIRLPRLVGLSRALDLILTGRGVSAEEALAMGLVNRVVERGSSLETAKAIAMQIASFPQLALRADLSSAKSQFGLSMDEALRLEFAGAQSALALETLEGAAHFSAGSGRHGRFHGDLHGDFDE